MPTIASLAPWTMAASSALEERSLSGATEASVPTLRTGRPLASQRTWMVAENVCTGPRAGSLAQVTTCASGLGSGL